jgi:hypothetical protein
MTKAYDGSGNMQLLCIFVPPAVQQNKTPADCSTGAVSQEAARGNCTMIPNRAAGL